jgi:hypothetical protein
MSGSCFIGVDGARSPRRGIESTLNLDVDGMFRQERKVSSVQTWVYESSTHYNSMSQDRRDGSPRVFWEAGEII